MTEEETDPVMVEALEWFVRLRDDKLTDEDRRAFEAWLHRDASHAHALARAERLWNRFDIAQPEFDRARRSRAPVSRRGVLLGAAVALAGGGSFLAMNRGLFAGLTTAVGERKTFTLADGSTAELGSYSALSSDFTATERTLTLYRGEAYFSVTKDPHRPFVVQAAGGSTRALGTRFDVKYVADLVTVAVDEHAVDVRAGSLPSVTVEEGWQTSYDDNGPRPPSKADLATIGAWRKDRIIFEDVPLHRVLSELERYRRGRIVLASRQIGFIPVTAVFDTHQIDEALKTIEASLPIHIFHSTGYVAVVYSAD